MTPLLHRMSVLITLASPTITVLPSTLMARDWPFTVLTDFIFAIWDAKSVPGTTWYVKMATSFSLFSGFSRSSTVLGGNFANASSVGAKTVKGPLPLRVSTRPAAWSAAARVLNEPAATAVSTMSCDAALGRAYVPRDRYNARATAAARETTRTLLFKLPFIFLLL